MRDISADRTAVLLLNHGAAEVSAGIETFLGNIFRDPEIIRLPGGPRVQRRFASLIAQRRAPRVRALYRYMGGGSPLLPYMRAQARNLAAELGGMRVEIGLRYYSPYIEDAVRRLVTDGFERVVAFPQYPQQSATTVGSVMNALDAALAAVPKAGDMEILTVAPFGAEPDFVAEIGARVRAAAAGLADPVLLFSAHSVPMKFIAAGDRYSEEVAVQADAIAATAGFDSYEIAYQSRSGPVRWLEPDVRDSVAGLLASGRREFVVVPISFVQDHLETLVELDVQLAAGVDDAGGRMVRVRAMNGSVAFTRLSARLVRRELSG